MDLGLLDRIPAEPGVYLMKDRRGRVIYVGKANDLAKRVRSYFRASGGDERPFVALGLLGRLLADIETVVVNNEKEALLLENNLIKQHQPRFNVRLTDDKSYLVLRIDARAAYPRIEVTRRIADDGARYFGPYHSATSCRETLRLINRTFHLRTCSDRMLAGRSRPCIQYQIQRCWGPCCFPVDREVYAAEVADVGLFLSGKKAELAGSLRQRMQEHAARQEYEQAAALRDKLLAVERTLTAQTVVSSEMIDQDVVGLHREGDVVEIVVLFMRAGKLLGRRSFPLREQELPDVEVVRGFVEAYYELGSFLPDEVLLPVPLEDDAAIAGALSERRGRRVQVLAPQRGPRARLIALAKKNARASYAPRPTPRRRSASSPAVSSSRARRGASSASTSPTSRARRPSRRWSSSWTASLRAPCTARSASNRSPTGRATG